MMNRREFARCAVGLGLLASGCNSGPKLVAVSGHVYIDGKPLTSGIVQVVPAGYRPAMGKIGPDGSFTLHTMDNSDGVLIGTHPAAVIAHTALGPGSQEWHAPKKYADVKTSNLTVTIDGPTNDLVINLTWAGGKPFVENSSGSIRE
jgi:hypothetical protein